MQEGQLIKASGSIYIRFYRNGKRVMERLCKIDDDADGAAAVHQPLEVRELS